MVVTPEQNKKILLLAYTKEDVRSALPIIKQCNENEKKIVVLGLDFASWIELRKLNIRYRTPSHYFNEKNCESIDLEALHLAKTWYKPFESKITYHGICLGEMAEYDFVYIFTDALKSIEIAYSLIDSEKPDEIWLPRNVPFFRPNNIRNEALIKAVANIANIRSTPVTYFTSNAISNNIKNRASKLITNFVPDTYYSLAGIKKTLHGLSKNNRKIVFIGLSEEKILTIKDELKKDKKNIVIHLSDLRELMPFRPFNNDAAEFIEKSNSLKNSKLPIDITYKDISVIENLISERVSEFFSSKLVTLTGYINKTESFIKNVKPDIVVFTEDISPFVRVITRVCKRNDIRTLVLQHGALAFDMKGFHVMPVEADVQAVWGESNKSWAINRGKSSESQVVTGNPKYDLLLSIKNSFKKENSPVYTELGLKREKGIILIATQWYSEVGSCFSPKIMEQFIWKSLEATKDFPDKQVVVKLHPTFCKINKEIVSAIVNELDLKNVVITEKFLWQLLASCDILIIQSSTAGLEAMLFDKPVITLNSSETQYFSPYAGSKSCYRIKLQRKSCFCNKRRSLRRRGSFQIEGRTRKICQ